MMFSYLLILNILSFLLIRKDKIYAKKYKRRIRESTIIYSIIFGGMLGAHISMKLYHHKTKKKYFIFLIYISYMIWMLLISFK